LSPTPTAHGGAPSGSAAPAPGAASSGSLVWRLISEYVRPQAWRLGLAALCMAVVAATTGALAWLLQPAVDRIFIDKDPMMLWLVPTGVIVVTIVKSLADYAQSMLMAFVGQRIIADTQVRMFGHMMRADLAWLNDAHSGKLLSTFLYDAQLLRESVSRAITGMAKDFLSVLFLAGVMFWQNWRLGLVSVLVFPIAGLAIRRLGKRMRKASNLAQEETGTLAALLNERLSGARLVKAYGMETAETERIRVSIDKRLGHIMKTVATRSAASPMTDALGGIAIAATILYAGHAARADAMTLGAFTSFLGAMLMAYQPLKSLANMNAALQEGLAAAERIFATLDVVPDIRDEPGRPPLRIFGGEIAFRDVRMTYPDGTVALDGVSFTVPAGRTLALVGPSGGGKTTALNLIPRFWDATSGAVEIDGQNVAQVGLASLRSQMALVAQEATLFDDTVAANIAYGRPGAERREVEAAARAAAAHEFIRDLPNGYDTVVGENGVKLSGGQRQRIAIARAMLRDAPILLLDEATSALDTASEARVQAALAELMRGRTTVLIAHRLSTVVDADRIVVIEHGRVVESGRHAELIARGGAYARLYAQQAGHAAEPAPLRAQAGAGLAAG
jgi:subfamily B ATP-binding cassette protein MsbA